MARALIVGCGCHGRAAAEELIEAGWAVRGTTREAGRLQALQDAGIEGVVADPNRVGSIVELLADVTVVAWLLGDAAGSRGEVEALYLQRLPSLLEKVVDTPVRGFVYEAAGLVERVVLAQGEASVIDASERWRIPIELVRDRRDLDGRWERAVVRACLETVGAG